MHGSKWKNRRTPWARSTCHLVGRGNVLSGNVDNFRKHVLGDLQPYVCTFSPCTLSGHLFDNRDAWFRHETQNHRIEFYCNTAGHQAFTHSDQDKFESHLVKDHGMQSSQSSAIIDMFKRPVPSMSGICNLCFRPAKNLKLHISRHLYQVAVFAIPRPEFMADDEDESSGILQKEIRSLRSNNNTDTEHSMGSYSSQYLSAGYELEESRLEMKRSQEGDQPFSSYQQEVPATEVDWDMVWSYGVDDARCEQLELSLSMISQKTWRTRSIPGSSGNL